jgi:hypothetical protein
MTKKSIVLVSAMLCLVMTAASSDAAGVFVATAKNLRGGLYMGFGPTPGHASEMAMVKCSQNSFMPRSCKVMCIRMECPPPVAFMPPPPMPAVRKTKVSNSYPAPPPPYGPPAGRPYGPPR